MRVNADAAAALMLCATFLARSACAASGRGGIVDRRARPIYLSFNNTIAALSTTPTPPVPAGLSSSSSSSSPTSQSRLLESSHGSIAQNLSTVATSTSSSALSSSQLHPVISSLTDPSSNVPTPPSPQPPTAPATFTTSTTSSPTPSSRVVAPISTPPASDRNTTVNYTVTVTTPIAECIDLEAFDQPVTHISVIYPSTVTFSGNRTDYTPPFEPLVTPNFCTPTARSALITLPPDVAHDDNLSDVLMGPTPEKGSPRKANIPVVTFITTDKNPAVVFPSDPVPRYSPTWIPDAGGGTHDSGYHRPADDGGDPGGASHPTPDAEGQGSGPRPTFKITAGGHQVVINDQTFSDLGPSKTTVVTVGGGTFIIYPTAVVGEGTVVQKPAPAGAIVSMAAPTSGVVGGLPVTLSGSEAIVGGITLPIAEGGTTTVVNGRPVSIGPGAVVVSGEMLSFRHLMAARETDVVVDGGELLTAIGRSVVVLHSTTITYGPGIPERSEVVNGDTITIGPSGILVHGMVMGGPSVNATITSYEIVGGATITRIAPSIAVINGVTFTVGPGTHWTTTVIAGETFTIGPTGIVASTLTLRYPFGSSVTMTVAPSATWLPDVPVETAGQFNDEDNKGGSLRPNVHVGWVAVCIATGVVWIFV